MVLRCADKTFWMLTMSAIQGTLASLVRRGRLRLLMDHRRCQPVQARMMADAVVPAEEVAAERLGILDSAKAFREVGQILQCFELGLGERVVIGAMRSGMGLGHPQIREQ